MPQLVDLEQIDRPVAVDDQNGPSTIAGSESDSENYRQFFDALLSQVKRVIHGNQSGNWHDDPASVFGGDASLYGLFMGFQGAIQKDLNDNDVDFVIIGDAGNDKVEVDYTLKLPVSGKLRVGKITVAIENTSFNMDDNYSFVAPEIIGVTFSISIVDGSVRLVITTSGVGENPILYYRITKNP